MSLGGQYEKELRGIENAVGIVQLRLADDEWSRAQGAKMLPQATTRQLLAHVATAAMTIYAAVVDAEKAKS